MELRLLGPVAAWHAGAAMPLGGPRQRAVLAVLAMRANETVSGDYLIDNVWEIIPSTPQSNLRTYITGLRRAFQSAGIDADRLVTRPGGYLLTLAPEEELDVARFHDLADRGEQALQQAYLDEAATCFASALALWHGLPLEGLAVGAAVRAEVAAWEDRHLTVLERRSQALIELGQHDGQISLLRRLVALHPYRERLWSNLMLALDRADRRAEALEVFAQARRTLITELGTEPGAELCRLQQRVLRGENAPTRRAEPVPHAAPPVPAAAGRNDLPGDVADFTGRAAELETLLAVDPTPASVVIEALDGMAGVGKTTLAVHAAHRLAASFPDVQLFIDLHGHTSDQEPVSPMAALDTLLRALGVPAEAIPNDLDARAALWRAELATRRAVLVLDNAASAGQVRPLLPGTSRCLAVITSRHRLADLETTHTLSLDVLTEQDAMALFARIVGAQRLTGQLAAAGEVISLCGRLPLAVRIAGARLRSRPAWTVRHLADRLHQAATPLTELSTGDRSVAAAFTLSYRHLDPAQQRMFRLLGLHPGVLFDAAAVATLTADPPVDVGSLLDALVDAHLLQEPTAGRYRFHDLLRSHAAATVAVHEPAHVRAQALARLTDFYLHTAYAASRQLDSQFRPIDIGEPAAGCVLPHLPDEAAAMSWFDTNHANVLAVLRKAEEQDRFAKVWQLAWTLDNYHYRRGHIQASLTSWHAGLAAAERLGDVAVQAKAHRRLGIAYGPAGEHVEAVRHLGLSLALAEGAGDVVGQAGAHFVLALTWRRRDDERVLTHITSALRLYRELGNTQWEIRSLSMLGACEARLGQHESARVHCETALALCRRNQDRYGEADTLDSLGALASHTGRHTTALDHYTAALAAWCNLDNTYRQADTLTAVGETHATMGQPDAAREAWQEAADLYDSQGRAEDADRVRRQIAVSTTGVTGRVVR
jgi:DNA-binding SARP family transcriptional activator